MVLSFELEATCFLMTRDKKARIWRDLHVGVKGNSGDSSLVATERSGKSWVVSSNEGSDLILIVDHCRRNIVKNKFFLLNQKLNFDSLAFESGFES